MWAGITCCKIQPGAATPPCLMVDCLGPTLRWSKRTALALPKRFAQFQRDQWTPSRGATPEDSCNGERRLEHPRPCALSLAVSKGPRRWAGVPTGCGVNTSRRKRRYAICMGVRNERATSGHAIRSAQPATAFSPQLALWEGEGCRSFFSFPLFFYFCPRIGWGWLV